MKIVINKEPFDDEMFKDENYAVYAEYTSNEDTTAYGAVNMCYEALKSESYVDESIIQAMYDIAMDKANEINYIINENN